MAGNIQNVSFASPASLVVPDAAAQQAQIQRNQMLAEALRQQSLQDTQAGRGAVSWTQGLSRLADALVAKKLNKKVDAQNTALAQQYATGLRQMFGGGAPGGQQEQQSGSRSSEVVGGPPQPGSLEALASQMGPAGNLGSPSPQQPAGESAPPSVPPSGAGAGMAPSQSGPMSLTGDPGRDMSMYMLNPEEYTKNVIASNAPVDMARTVQQAQSAMARGDLATANALLAKVQHDNYTAPLNGRPGSTLRDPYNPSRILGYDAPSVEGAFPVYGPDGMPTGYQQAPGAASAIQQQAAAKATGQAAGDLVDVYNPQTQQMVKVPKSAVLSGAANGGAPFAAGAPLGASNFAGTMGDAGGKFFSGLADSASDAPNRIYALRQMLPLVTGPSATQFGPGTDVAVKFAGFVNGIGKSLKQNWNFNGQNITNINEFNKFASQYSARAAQDLGLGGSDKRIEMTVAATPNGHMTNDALRHVIPQMIGFENAKQGMANAAAQYARMHPGPNAQADFLTSWRANYDPRIYTWMADGTVKQNMAALKKSNPADYSAIIRKATLLGQIGAIPQ